MSDVLNLYYNHHTIFLQFWHSVKMKKLADQGREQHQQISGAGFLCGRNEIFMIVDEGEMNLETVYGKGFALPGIAGKGYIVSPYSRCS